MRHDCLNAVKWAVSELRESFLQGPPNHNQVTALQAWPVIVRHHAAWTAIRSGAPRRYSTESALSNFTPCSTKYENSEFIVESATKQDEESHGPKCRLV
jgi:hypothetical protein